MLCATIPIRLFVISGESAARPLILTLPEFGRASSAAILSSVVFPAPLGPSNATNSAGLDFQTDAPQGHERAVTLFDLVEDESQNARGAVAGFNVFAQPRTRSRRVCSTCARCRAYSSSEMVPAWWRSSRRKSFSLSSSRPPLTSRTTDATAASEAAAGGEVLAAGAAARGCIYIWPRAVAGYRKLRASPEIDNSQSEKGREAADENPFEAIEACGKCGNRFAWGCGAGIYRRISGIVSGTT